MTTSQALIALIPSYGELCQTFTSGDGCGVTIEMRASTRNDKMGHPESFLVIERSEGAIGCPDDITEITQHVSARDACGRFAELVRVQCEAYFDPELI